MIYRQNICPAPWLSSLRSANCLIICLKQYFFVAKKVKASQKVFSYFFFVCIIQQTPAQKSEQEIQEEEELQLALAISMSEAQAKEKEVIKAL